MILLDIFQNHGITIAHYVVVSAVLFSIGVFGVLYRRNAITMFMCIELMLNAVNLLLVAFSTYHHDNSGQVFVFFIMAVAAAEVAVGLAILVTIFRNIHTIDIDELKSLKW
ncbi:MAG: NADH-quinone oxidoreductase subunit NuoK [Chitinophagales bacterium]